MKTLLIIPAYNEEKNIFKLVKKVQEFNKNFDYIVINDGSKDKTLKILQDNSFKHINLIQNLGIGGAVQTGYKYAYENGYDIAIQFDGDGQHDIKYIEKLCKPIKEGQANIVIGSRYLDKDTSIFKSTFMRRVGGKIISFILYICIREGISDPTSGFRAVDKNVIRLFAQNYPIDYPEPESLVSIIKEGYKIKEISVSMNERENGKSSIKICNSIYYMLKVSLAIIIDNLNRKKVKKKCR